MFEVCQDFRDRNNMATLPRSPKGLTEIGNNEFTVVSTFFAASKKETIKYISASKEAKNRVDYSDLEI
jgi:hypothetical protein